MDKSCFKRRLFYKRNHTLKHNFTLKQFEKKSDYFVFVDGDFEIICDNFLTVTSF